ncbi:hypothetical protein [Shimia sp. R9_3]|uniref:ImuA family protein n=1 Tax=Shimia sp. R9_3 TaxID=2821113 RepID=UPI001ADC7F11|nr:hypothetical protein [Shimia sp. R9_3]MBO9403417.1 hypothetical protein [Shimia sp. R9_3]
MTDSLPPPPPLAKGRMHEAFGPGGPVFAFVLGHHCRGTIIWVRDRWRRDRLDPNGFKAFIDPAELYLCKTKDHAQALGVAEDALRSGAVALVVVELSKEVTLTQGRRLQLAAREGKSTGLALISEGMGSNAAETRWRCRPVFDPHIAVMHQWDLVKNKSGAQGSWRLWWDSEAKQVRVVSHARA